MATTEQVEQLKRDEIAKLAEFLNTSKHLTPVDQAEQLYDRLEISYQDEIGRYVSVGTGEGESGDAEDGGTGDGSASG